MENLKILIIGDDPTNCTLLKTILEMQGYQTASVHNIENEDIISLLNNQKPDVLFLDFYLGASETLKYITSIRTTPDWQRLPVLMTSAIDHDQECLVVGATGFILKPFNWDEITNNVHEICNQISNREEVD